MKNFIYLSCIVAILSCQKNDEDCCSIVDIGINVKYINELNQNFFEMDNGYNLQQVKMYHKIDGIWKPYYEGNLDQPTGLGLIEIDSEKYLAISPSLSIDENGYSDTKIEFNENDADSIRTKIDTSHSNTIVTELYYNGVLKWKSQDATPRRFTIIKNSIAR